VSGGDDADAFPAGDARLTVLEAAVAERDAKLAERDAKLAEQEARLAAQDAQLARLAEQDAKLAEQEAKLTELTVQVAKLTELLNRNSSNSHLPPSSDGPGASSRGAAAGKPRHKSKRGRGGQKGHRGNHRALLPPECVNTFFDLFPPACLGCGHSLPRKPDVMACRYQQLELRDHRPHVTEWRRHEVDCERCGASTRAEYDPKQIPSSAFGPCLVAVVAMLTGAYHLSRRKTKKLLHELFGITISLGAISAMERRASEALASCHQEALREVQHAGVKHTDATSFVRSGRLTSLWVLATSMVTVYQLFNDGCRDTIRPMFGSLVGILVSDRATVFSFWTMGRRQICHAHLLRKFVAFSERTGVVGAIGRELLECTRLIFEYWHGYKDGHLTRQELLFWMRPLQRAFEHLLARGQKADVDGVSGSCTDILAHREALWTFLFHDGVEPTNNHAELELRDFVLWRKRSYGTQSKRGDRFAERVMTVVRTARKQGKAVLQFIVDSITAHLDRKTPPRLLGASSLA
jgi:transposase